MRHYKRQTSRGTFPREAMLSAVEMVENGSSIRKAASAQGVNYRTLSRYVKVKTATGTLDNASLGKGKVRQIFSDLLEEQIVEYLVHAARIFYGLTTTELRTLAYNLALANGITNLPRNWSADSMAVEAERGPSKKPAKKTVVDVDKRRVANNKIVRKKIPELSDVENSDDDSNTEQTDKRNGNDRLTTTRKIKLGERSAKETCRPSPTDNSVTTKRREPSPRREHPDHWPADLQFQDSLSGNKNQVRHLQFVGYSPELL